MQNIGRDILIFALIAGPISFALLNIPIEHGCIERRWCKLFYSSPVSQETASDVIDALFRKRVFLDERNPNKRQSPHGQPDARLTCDDEGVYRLEFVADPTGLQDKSMRELYVDVMTQVCNSAFNGKKACVWLIDPDQVPFDNLVETQLFDSSSATANYD